MAADELEDLEGPVGSVEPGRTAVPIRKGIDPTFDARAWRRRLYHQATRSSASSHRFLQRLPILRVSTRSPGIHSLRASIHVTGETTQAQPCSDAKACPPSSCGPLYVLQSLIKGSKGASSMVEIAWEDFEKVDVRVGKVVAAEPFPEARKPSIKLSVDFGPEVGEKKTSAQLTAHYAAEDLVGRQVVAVVNFPPKRIAGFKSEVLVLGVPDEAGEVVLLSPDLDVPPGGRMF